MLSNGQDRKMWLTRALSQKVCLSLSEALEKTVKYATEKVLPAAEIEKSLNAEHKLAVKKNCAKDQSANNFVDESKNTKKTATLLCNSVNIKYGKSWIIQFLTADTKHSCEISTSRENFHVILSALVTQCKHAHWNITELSDWVDN